MFVWLSVATPIGACGLAQCSGGGEGPMGSRIRGEGQQEGVRSPRSVEAALPGGPAGGP